ncbi:hypothetical protein NC797_07600 [Aquibacillus sp. 3ASR75-11]|uniref:Uncharacterized protein n=1 Tax=Terrihalobacillus insolitus TaxID=2950438 RepID=A0A9X3WRD5_9BACI|nr:hypothetical protein [Terrihalobacillus insolitus]MDC3424370.1 hypothetical protein [Terrihalobacillus insolitus]
MFPVEKSEINYVLTKNCAVATFDTAEEVRICLEEELEDNLEFFVMLQECDDDELEIFLHSDNQEDLDEVQLARLEKLGLSEDNCIEELCKFLNVSIREINPDVKRKELIKRAKGFYSKCYPIDFDQLSIEQLERMILASQESFR